MGLTLLTIKKVWDRAPHNAFTDLLLFQGHLFLVLREGQAHAGGDLGKIVLLQIDTTGNWELVKEFSLAGYDLRDPKLIELADGTLLLHFEACRGSEYCPFYTKSTNSHDWTPLQPLSLPGEWLSRITLHRNSYFATSYSPLNKSCAIYTSVNAVNWSHYHTLPLPLEPTEATIAFKKETAYILLRRKGTGLIGKSIPPYTAWVWHELPFEIGGPHCLFLQDGLLCCSFREIVDSREEMAVYLFNGHSFIDKLNLPSEGDCGYSGMVIREKELLVSYYSSFEEKSSVYLATVQLPDLQDRNH